MERDLLHMKLTMGTTAGFKGRCNLFELTDCWRYLVKMYMLEHRPRITIRGNIRDERN